MTKVVLIALLSLVAARSAGMPVAPATPDHERTTLAPIPALAVALRESAAVPACGGWADFAEGKFAVLPGNTATAFTPAPAFAPLVSVNRLAIVEWAVSDARLTLAMRRDAPGDTRSWALLQAASESEGGWRHRDPVAALSSTHIEAVRPQRSSGRDARERKFWPQRRPVRGAQVWLTRKQP